MSEEKFVKLGIKTNPVKITPKTDPNVLIDNMNPDFESELWSFLLLIIDINIGFKDDINIKGIANKRELPIKHPASRLKFNKYGSKIG